MLVAVFLILNMGMAVGVENTIVAVEVLVDEVSPAKQLPVPQDLL